MVDTSTAKGRPPIAIIGAGRVGSTLTTALHTAGYPITTVVSRTPAHAAELAERVSARVVDLRHAFDDATLTLFAVPDDSLADLARTLADTHTSWHGRMIAHCSGASPVAVLAPLAARGAHIGGFHPLVAVSSRHHELPGGITFAIEAEEPLRTLLWQMAYDLRGQPWDLHPASRTLYHAAAVLASNYTVVLAALASELLERAGLETEASLQALLPLLRSTMANLETLGLPDALTGPLVRGDAGTIAQHLRTLDREDPGIAQVYRALGAAALPLVADRVDLSADTLQTLEIAIGGQGSGVRQHEWETCPALEQPISNPRSLRP